MVEGVAYRSEGCEAATINALRIQGRSLTAYSHFQSQMCFLSVFALTWLAVLTLAPPGRVRFEHLAIPIGALLPLAWWMRSGRARAMFENESNSENWSPAEAKFFFALVWFLQEHKSILDMGSLLLLATVGYLQTENLTRGPGSQHTHFSILAFGALGVALVTLRLSRSAREVCETISR